MLLVKASGGSNDHTSFVAHNCRRPCQRSHTPDPTTPQNPVHPTSLRWCKGWQVEGGSFAEVGCEGTVVLFPASIASQRLTNTGRANLEKLLTGH